MQSITLVLAQLNFLVGDIKGNTARIIEAAAQARSNYAANVIVCSELALTGYPPEDLLLRPGLYRRIEKSLIDLCAVSSNIDIIVGYPIRKDDRIYNACSLLRKGRIAATYYKQDLPNYSVFDEKRYFAPGHGACVVDLHGIPTALTICEDMWSPGPSQQAKEAGAKLIINLNGSPYHAAKPRLRHSVLGQRATETGIPIVYVNQVGGQDELVFDGASMVINGQGQVQVQAIEFEECLLPVRIGTDGCIEALVENHSLLTEEAAIYQALCLGVRDYVNKNGFPGAVLGLSGGIDSSLTLAIASDALGSEKLDAVMMPSRYTADISLEDAISQAELLGVAYHVISIEAVFKAFNESLMEIFAGLPADTTEENIQSRCRGVLLMALSNKLGKIVLATGNKSEMAVGYATLYGDMAGGFAPLKDIKKTLVYRLARWRNEQSPTIPQRVLTRAPSAELAPDQFDTDSLPPYDILDRVLEGYIEQDRTPAELIADGLNEAAVKRVVKLIDRNEYKRRQAAPGVRITARAFGRDRRYPITSAYSELD
jgi:NAD+ synthase (glutamine-hydrolysing)